MGMRTGLSLDDLPELLTEPYIGVLATRRPDDSVLLSPVWWEWRHGGINIWVDTLEDRKVAHLRRDPRTTFVVSNDRRPYLGFEIRGEARIASDDFVGVVERVTGRFRGLEEGARRAASVPPGLVIRIEPGVMRGWMIDD